MHSMSRTKGSCKIIHIFSFIETLFAFLISDQREAQTPSTSFGGCFERDQAALLERKREEEL